MHPIRVLLAKIGLDGHDRGVQIVARALRDAGTEVIYTGLWQTPEAIVRAAEDEDVDVLGLSILSGAHLTLVPTLMEQLRSAGLQDVTTIVGGIIPEADVAALQAMGVDKVFTPGTPLPEISDFVRSAVVS